MATDLQSAAAARVAAFQIGVAASLVIAAAVLAASADAATSTIGRTWPIAEPDALAEIEAGIARQPASIAPRFGPRSQWSALKAAPLAPAARSQIRYMVPFYTLDFDIRLPGGKVLYPRGFRFNPLAYVSLPQRIVIVHPGDLSWAVKTAALTDWILIAAGQDEAPGGGPDDALSLGERYGRPVFILEERVKQRLGLTAAPVIVRQAGQRLELTEVRLERKPARKAKP